MQDDTTCHQTVEESSFFPSYLLSGELKLLLPGLGLGERSEDADPGVVMERGDMTLRYLCPSVCRRVACTSRSISLDGGGVTIVRRERGRSLQFSGLLLVIAPFCSS